MFDHPLLSETVWNDRIYSQGWRPAKGGTLRVQEPATGRILRGGVIGEKNRQYVEPARVIGASETRVMYSHVPPTLRPPIIDLART